MRKFQSRQRRQISLGRQFRRYIQEIGLQRRDCVDSQSGRPREVLDVARNSRKPAVYIQTRK